VLRHRCWKVGSPFVLHRADVFELATSTQIRRSRRTRRLDFSIEGNNVSGRYFVKCSCCAYRREIAVPPRAYAFPEGKALPIPDAFGWCHSCNHVTCCEALPALADVERLLRQAEREGNEPLVAEMEHTKKWISARVSPPRCLDCGSTAIRPFPLGWSVYLEEESDEDFLDIPHPSCSGMLRVEMSGWSLYRGWFAQYSPEGEKIANAFSA